MEKKPTKIDGDSERLEIFLDKNFKIIAQPTISTKGLILEYLILKGLNEITYQDGKTIMKFQSYDEAIYFYVNKMV